MSTQVATNRVYRSQDVYVAGVCSGIAEYFDLDPIVVRILAIFLIILTFGLGAIAYLVLWVRLPQKPESTAPYEITPESAESHAFGLVNPLTGSTSADLSSEPATRVSLVARVAIAACLMILFLLVATNVSPLVPGTEWWQFWPLGVLILGLCLIIIPITTRYEAVWHALGIVITSMGATLLPMSLCVMSWATLSQAVSQAWPLIALALIFGAIGVYRNSSALVIGASFFIVAFCIFSLAACAIPGDMEELWLSMPDGRTLRIFFIEP